LQEALPDKNAAADLDQLARTVVAKFMANERAIPGIGHRVHKPADPRAAKLFEIAAANGFSGKYVVLMKAIAEVAGQAMDKSLPVNATGAIAAIASEMGLHWNIVRGIGVMGRAVGLVGHIREELSNPLAREITTRVIEESSSQHFGAATE